MSSIDFRAVATNIMMVNPKLTPGPDLNPVEKWVQAQRATVTLVSEGASPNYNPPTTFRGGSGSDAQEVVVTTGPAVTGERFVLHGPYTPNLGNRVDHARYVAEVTGVVGGIAVSLMSMHANAAIQDRGGLKSVPGAQQWGNAFEGPIATMFANRLATDTPLIVGGDLNWHNSWPNSGKYGSPAHVFNRLGMKFANTELMWLAWSHHFTLKGQAKTIPNAPGSDHLVALLCDYTLTKAVTPDIQPTPPVSPAKKTTRGQAVDAALRELNLAQGSGDRLARIKDAIKATEAIPFIG